MIKMMTKLLGVACLIISTLQPVLAQDPEAKLGWKLGSQAYTFKEFTFVEALAKIDSCGLKYVEAFNNQTIGGGIEGKMDFRMEPAKRTLILAKLKEKGIKMVAFGVVNGNTPEEWEQLFQFAQAMGLDNLTSEPKEADLPMISKLCDKYKVNLAIHNHPNPSHYWNPDIVLNAIKGLSPRVGACADIGHWVRSGLDPVECLKKLAGHIKGSHMKDLNEKAKSGHDVPWGTGVSNIAGVIEELKKQKFKGVISAEYEYNWLNNAHEVATSAKNFREMVRK